MSQTTSVAEIIRGTSSFQLGIFDAEGVSIGRLEPLTWHHLHDQALLASLTAWRTRASSFFMTQFEASPQRTKNWLEGTVLRDPTRLLFLIYSPQKLIGQYGFKSLTSESADLDNLIRGEGGGHPKLIYFAEIALLRWLFTAFSLVRIHADVLADNTAVLDLHRAIGFEDGQRIPLRRRVAPGSVILDYGEPGASSPDNLYCQRIFLLRTTFQERHGI